MHHIRAHHRKHTAWLKRKFCVQTTFRSKNYGLITSHVSRLALQNDMLSIYFNTTRYNLIIYINPASRYITFPVIYFISGATVSLVYFIAPWWRHQMETYSALLAICAGNSPVTGEFPAQRPVTRSFNVFFDLCLIKRMSKQSRGWWFETPSGPLWRHSNVYVGDKFDA